MNKSESLYEIVVSRLPILIYTLKKNVKMCLFFFLLEATSSLHLIRALISSSLFTEEDIFVLSPQCKCPLSHLTWSTSG